MPVWETTTLGLGLLLCGSCSPSAVSSAPLAQATQPSQPVQASQPADIPTPTMESALSTATFAAG